MVRLAASIVMAVGLLVGCGSSPPGDTPSDASDQQSDAAPMPDASAVCVPLGNCDWLTDYQRRIVGSLSGAEDIAPGVKLAHRASVGERNAARQFLLDELTALGYTPSRHDY